jgi:hypothetical protein
LLKHPSSKFWKPMYLFHIFKLTFKFSYHKFKQLQKKQISILKSNLYITLLKCVQWILNSIDWISTISFTEKNRPKHFLVRTFTPFLFSFVLYVPCIPLL